MNKLNGYKTYLIALGAVIYGWGIQKGLWPHDPLVDYLLGGGAIATIRHGIKTEAAKVISAALMDPPEFPAAPPTSSTASTPAVRTEGPGAAGKAIVGLLVGALLISGLLLLPGCQSSTLAPGGAYAPLVTNTVSGTNAVSQSQGDMALFLIDSAYQTAWSGMNAAFDIERNNRAFLLSISPDIKHSLDAIRPEATRADAQFAFARAAYAANPTPANVDDLHAVLAKIQQLAAAAQAALPQFENPQGTQSQ